MNLLIFGAALIFTVSVGSRFIKLQSRYSRARQNLARSQNWPSSTGQILSQTIPIEYSYKINDVEYHGTSVLFGLEIGDSTVTGQDLLSLYQRFPESKLLPVYYDPQEPSDSVLEKRIWGPLLGQIRTAALLSILGIAILAWEVYLFLK